MWVKDEGLETVEMGVVVRVLGAAEHLWRNSSSSDWAVSEIFHARFIVLLLLLKTHQWRRSRVLVF